MVPEADGIGFQTLAGAGASGARLTRRGLAHKYHPDVSDDPDGEDKFKELSEVNKTLKVPTTRTAYDRLVSPRQGRQTMEWLPVDSYAGWSVLSWMDYWIEWERIWRRTARDLTAH